MKRTIVWIRRAILLLAAAALLWVFAIPMLRPPLKDGEQYGIDVAHHQGEIVWDQVAADNIGFVYIKATEGGDFVDPSYRTNLRGAGAAGLETGSYHFFTACTDGILQAENFLSIAPPTPGMLTPAIDLETAGNCINAPAPDVVAIELDRFLARVEQAWGEPPLVYLMSDWEDVFPTADRLAHPMWARSIPFRPGGTWDIWQLPPYAKVDGVDGRVDLNVMTKRP